MASSTTLAQRPDRVSRRIFATVFLTFVGYATVALPLAVVPTYVANDLGFGAVVAGFAIGTQYVATILSRAQVGRMADLYGPKRAVAWGFAGCLLSGLLTLGAAIAQGAPSLSLGLLLAGRLALGIAESWISTGAIAWAIGQVGPQHTARIISWNGIAVYGALALAAPLGVVLAQRFGFSVIGIVSYGLGVVGLALTLGTPSVAVSGEAQLGQGRVAARVLPFGCTLALAAMGFGAIAAFVTLYFASRHWQGASLSLTLFGCGFIVARLMFSGFIPRFGGLRVTLASLIVEGLGLVVLWQAPTPLVAMLGAGLTGFGFAPIFPALGVEAVKRVPPQNRGAAIGLYSVFMDVALCITGPLAGLLLERCGAAAPFWLGAAACLLGMALTVAMLLG